MDWFTAKELMEFRNVSIDKLKEARDIWYKHWTSKKTMITGYIVWIILFIIGSYYSINWLNAIWLFIILWSYWKEKELNWYIEGYQDWWDGWSENMQKNIGINVKLTEEIYYENPDL